MNKESSIMKLSTAIFDKNSSLWSDDPSIQGLIDKRLGWLDSVQFCLENQVGIETFVKRVKAAGLQQIVLLGMGGSGLAPEVFSKLFSAEGGLQLLVLDSTCTEQILAFEESLEIDETLFLVSSKSGNTIETWSLFEYFYTKLEMLKGSAAGQQFAAITDADSDLEKLAEERQFMHCFINPSDIGGRFSALSYFGLVPAALLGVSLDRLLASAQQAWHDCHTEDGAGIRLGQWLMQGYHDQQLDKLILHVPEKLVPLVWWIEQLVAESLGKQGQGILPVLNIESSSNVPLSNSKHLHIALGSDQSDFSDVRKACWGLVDKYAVAAHFFHWEFAVALAGQSLGINPFDEPNVTEAKVRTRQLLADYPAEAVLPVPEEGALAEVLPQLLSQASEDSYVSILAYWPINLNNDTLLGQFKSTIEQQFQVPVTINYGPRYLHSTGQLHKGGKRQGVFIVLTQSTEPDLAIPNQNYSFNKLCRAQALGDFQILSEKDLPAIFYSLTDLGQLSLSM